MMLVFMLAISSTLSPATWKYQGITSEWRNPSDSAPIKETVSRKVLLINVDVTLNVVSFWKHRDKVVAASVVLWWIFSMR